MSETEAYLQGEIALQTERDIVQLAQALRRVALEVRSSARARGVSRRAALLEHRFASSAGVDFFAHDRAARKWSSTRAVRAIWRHTVLNLYNETVLSTAADHGLTRLRIAHVNPSSSFHDMIVGLSASGEHPTYAEIRDEAFHPNADAILVCEAA